MDTTFVILGVTALALGIALGWLLGSRGGEKGKATAEALRLQLDEVVKERDANRGAVQELAGLKASFDERERSFEQQLIALREAKESLSAQFHEIGSKFLGEARKQFIEQAGEKFTQAVTPVEALLKTYQ